jgi:hypothetical protein
MSLKQMRAFGNTIDIKVTRTGAGKLTIVVTPQGKAAKTYRIKEGATAMVDLLN